MYGPTCTADPASFFCSSMALKAPSPPNFTAWAAKLAEVNTLSGAREVPPWR